MTERESGDPPELLTEPARPPGTGSPEAPMRADGQAPSRSETAPPTTKTGIAFGALIAGAIVLIVLLVFILENTASVEIS
ncbi:MAG: hypothetical protein ACRDPA_26025, partial [Solirubrobacteraceae bacterium]